MSQDDDDFLDALINQNDEQNEEEEDGPLPVLHNIWERPMLTRTVGIDDTGCCNEVEDEKVNGPDGICDEVVTR